MTQPARISVSSVGGGWDIDISIEVPDPRHLPDALLAASAAAAGLLAQDTANPAVAKSQRTLWDDCSDPRCCMASSGERTEL